MGVRQHWVLQTQTRSSDYSSLQGHLVGIEFNQVPSLPTIGEGYGTTSPTIGTRMRLYSESVGRSYVASSVARSMSHGGSHSGFHTAGLGGLEGSRRGEREPLIP